MPEKGTRPLDLVTMGRAAVDLYGEQVGGRLFRRHKVHGADDAPQAGVVRIRPQVIDHLLEVDVAQHAVAVAEMNWLGPCGKPVSK